MYNKIVNPKTGRKVNINSILGKNIIKNYFSYLKKDGFKLNHIGGTFENDGSLFLMHLTGLSGFDHTFGIIITSNIEFKGVEALSIADVDFKSDLVLKIGALMRSCQIAGGLESLLDQSVRYANERIQFGRPIAKFQAIQQELAVLATHVAASGVAADYASSSMDNGGDELAIASAKSRVDDAISVCASIAHQVHGAIGFTYEHGLHFSTRRLWSWRAEYGAGSYWAKILGEKAVSNGANNFWPSITSGKI